MTANQPARDIRVLVVDDNESQRRLLPRMLALADVSQVRFEANARSVLPAVEAFDPHLILLDMYLLDGNGFDVLRQLAEEDPGWPQRNVLLVTGDTSQAVVLEAISLGARGVLHKPVQVDEVIEAVTWFVERMEPSPELP